MALTMSDSGYLNDKISLKWLKHFDWHIWKKRKGIWCMLIMNGAESYTHLEFVQVCYSKNIFPFCLPPHTTHFFPSLDIVYFHPFKHYYAEAIDTIVQLGDAKFLKIEFLACIITIQKQIFKKNTIFLSFCKTGFISLNFFIVLNKLQKFKKGSQVISKPSL